MIISASLSSSVTRRIPEAAIASNHQNHFLQSRDRSVRTTAPLAMEVATLLNGAPLSDGTKGKSKETVLNDVTNTGVMAALVGGFALSSVQSGSFDHEVTFDNVAYLLLILGVHACTCSALTSALLYRHINAMSEAEVPPWSIANWIMLLMPMGKFGMGCAAYIVSVIFMSWRSLEIAPVPRAVSLAIGLGSMSTVVMTVVMLTMQSYRPAAPAKGA